MRWAMKGIVKVLKVEERQGINATVKLCYRVFITNGLCYCYQSVKYIFFILHICSYAQPAQSGPIWTRLCSPCIAAIAG